VEASGMCGEVERAEEEEEEVMGCLEVEVDW
jgi:hypothetical protein